MLNKIIYKKGKSGKDYPSFVCHPNMCPRSAVECPVISSDTLGAYKENVEKKNVRESFFAQVKMITEL